MRRSRFLTRLSIVGCSAAALVALLDSYASAAFTEKGATVLGGVNFTARSASLADFDNDGDLDLMFQHSSGVSFHRNNVISTGTPSFTFTDVSTTLRPNLTADRPGSAWSAAWADYDGDGWVDVFVGQTNSGSDRGDVLKNNGPAARFTNPSAAIGLDDPGFHQNVAWADINNDRRLDLVLGMEGPELHEIYLQNASGQFIPVGAQAGIQVAFGTKAYGMAVGDTDGDGDLDIYISTCRTGGNIRNNFFKNMLKETGTLTFVDIADTNGTQLMYNSYGTEFVDFDNDGDLDLYVTGAMNDSTNTGEPTKIFRNDGNNNFTDVDTILGHPLLSNQGIDLNGGKAIDYDNDGDLDLYFHDNLTGAGYNHRLFRNDGNWQFTDVTLAEGLDKAFNLESGNLVQRPVGAGAYDSTWGDLDRDGDLDLIAPNNSTLSGVSTPERLFVNDASTNGNKWLYVDLAGPTWNTTGVGSALFATMADGSLQGVTLRREANTNAGTFNQSDVPVHFGMGTSTMVGQLLVQWPDGSKQIVRDIAANQYLTVRFLPGDYDGNSIVDASDYIVWRKGLGTLFQASDYGFWRENFGKSLAGSGQEFGATVPEPAAIGLLLSAIPLLGRVRRR